MAVFPVGPKAFSARGREHSRALNHRFPASVPAQAATAAAAGGARASMAQWKLVLAAAALAGLTACSVFDEPSPAETRANNAPGDFPDVNAVTEDRPLAPTSGQLESVAQGLVADQAAGRYVQSETRRAASEVAAPPPPVAETATVPGGVPGAPTLAAVPPTAATIQSLTGGPGGPGAAAATPTGPGSTIPVPPMNRYAAAPALPPGIPPPYAPGLPGGAGVAATPVMGTAQTAALTGAAGGLLVSGAAGPFPLESYNPIGVSVSSKVGVIYFANSSSALDANDVSVIRQIAAYQQQYGGTLRVIGHASSRTGDMGVDQHNAVNQRVSVRRANAVARGLMGAGVPGSAIFVGAVGAQQKVYQEVMPSGEAHNRRTEVYLDY